MPMPKAKPREGPFYQILVAVVIALLVGGSAPWWWHELKGLGGAPSDSSKSEQSDPEKAARELVAAWGRKDRNAALRVANATVVDRLFSAPALEVNSKDLTCYPTGSGQRDCQMPHAKGIVIFRLMESDRGWRVQAADD